MPRPRKYPVGEDPYAPKYPTVHTSVGSLPTLHEFVKHHWSLIDPATLKWSWHMDVLCDHFTAWSENKWFDWICNIPPRHSKSIISNVFFPAWMWLDQPELRFLLATSDAKLTNRDSALFKKIVLDPDNYIKRYGLKWRLTEDQSARDQMTNSGKGARVTVAIGTNAGVTGHNGDYIIADDPNQTLAGVESEAIREKVNTWWDVAMSTRGVDSFAHRLIQQQRVHEDDLTGHIIANCDLWEPGKEIRGGVWVHLVMRAMAEPNDTPETPIWKETRMEGEVLCPDRFSKTFLNERKKVMRNEFYSQYQQKTSNPDGDKFKREWFRYFTIDNAVGCIVLGDRRYLLRDCWRLCSADMAIGEKLENDFTAEGNWIVTPVGDICLMDVLRFKEPHYVVKETFRAQHTNFKPTFFALDGSIQGTEIQQEFSNVGIPVMCVPNSTDKIVRSMPASILMQNGKVWFREGADWLPDFEHELLVFPNGKNDDQVDMLSYAVLGMQNLGNNPVAHSSHEANQVQEDVREWRRRDWRR